MRYCPQTIDEHVSLWFEGIPVLVRNGNSHASLAVERTVLGCTNDKARYNGLGNESSDHFLAKFG